MDSAISDYGNIQIEAGNVLGKPINQPVLTELEAKLTSKLKACHERKNVAFVIGGSKDMNLAIAPACDGITCLVFSTNQTYIDALNGQQVSLPMDMSSLGRVHVAIDLESVRGAEGVTERKDDVSDLYEASAIAKFLLEAAKTLGRDKLTSISITDYNPILEDQRTGRMLTEFFYRICLGLSMHQ